jgi:hypothetical protein
MPLATVTKTPRTINGTIADSFRLSRVISIDVPVSEHLGPLAGFIAAVDPEAGDRPLPTFVVPVEQIDHHALPVLSRGRSSA